MYSMSFNSNLESAVDNVAERKGITVTVHVVPIALQFPVP